MASQDGIFLDTYAGGWQDLFPTYGSRTLYYGAQIGVHGEACLYPWTCEIVRDEPDDVTVSLSLRLRRSPFLLRKTLQLTGDRPALQIRETVVNESAAELSFMWGQHPAFGVPFLDDSVRIRLAGSPEVIALADVAENCRFFGGEAKGLWPFLPDENGKPVDMSRACAPQAKRCLETCVFGLAEGKYEIINENLGLGLRMSWDQDVFPYVWVWANYGGLEGYPWYGRGYVLALEPWSTIPADYQRAAQNGGRLLKLGAYASMETALCAEVILEPKAVDGR